MIQPQNKNGFRSKQSDAASPSIAKPTANSPNAFALIDSDADEVKTFLRLRPVHTVAMMSFIKDNGLVNRLNRGTFFGFRNAGGNLEGVALIGHTTLVEARSETALQAFAAEAKKSVTPIKLMMSDGKNIERFWQYFSDGIRQPRLACEEKLFELSSPVLVKQSSRNVRLAVETELEKVAEAHAEVAFAESGIDPLKTDREGFLSRALRRIEQGRTFVVFEGEELVFKADIAAQTDEVIYLEGIYVSAVYRGNGIASECLSTLGQILLKKAAFICFLSNVEFTSAHRSYRKAGFKSEDSCTTLFV